MRIEKRSLAIGGMMIILGAHIFSVLGADAPATGIRISELMAANTIGLRDEEGDSSDWIELLNAGPDVISLDGWFLTDDPDNLSKWRVPNVSMGVGQFLVIFASGKDRSNPFAPLHTNFRLAQSGEYLGLVSPAGAVMSEFAPAFPPQQNDVSYGRDPSYPASVGFYPTPTPGATNGTSETGMGPDVAFSTESKTYVQSFQLTLSTPLPSAEIRYEIIANAASLSNAPTASSLLYTGPITITNSVQVRARTFVAGGLPGPVRSESFVRLNTNVLGFSSDLPVIVLHSFGGRAYRVGSSSTNHTPAFMAVFEPRNGRSSLTNSPDATTRIGFNEHGGSTGGLPKSSYNLETWDEFNLDKDVSLLGMPPESDWLFHAPNNFEPVLIHHPFINEISRQMGQYAPRTRLVEVFVSGIEPAGSIGTPQYQGVYVVMEKIKRSPSRVNIDRVDPQDTTSPAVTGGYLLKVERTEPHEAILAVRNIGSVGSPPLLYQDPEAREILRPEYATQRHYITNFYATVTASLASPNFTNPVIGYAQYLDTASWIDNHLLNVLAFNVDAFRLGGFYAKHRDVLNERDEIVRPGWLTAGPIYDFDRSLGSSDGRDFAPRVWRSTLGDLGTDFFHFGWYDRLFQDPDFWQKWIDRWQTLRQSTLSSASMNSLIDSLREEVRQAQPRDQARWPNQGPRTNTVSLAGFTYSFNNGYEGEIAFLKHWLSNRVDFIDTNFLARPSLVTSGDAQSGFTLRLTGPASAGSVIYYTLDGSDPRLPGGALSPSALIYSSPLLVTTNARLVARTRNLSHRNLTGANNPPLSSPWSGPTTQTLVVLAPTLRITEVMYHPVGEPSRPLQFEYIELRNIGGPINLRGFRLRGAVDFTFPERRLENGEYVLVVGDAVGFQSRYGATPMSKVAGQYNMALNDESGHIVLEGPVGEVIHDFTYQRDWFPVTHGLGFSLVIQSEYLPLREREEGQTVDNWDQVNNWRPSTELNGSPGTGDPVPGNIPPIYVNEVLTRPGTGQSTFIELANVHGPNANVGGWYLSDDFSQPRKYRIPTGTMLPLGGYLVFEESQFNAAPGSSNSFTLRVTGGSIYLFSADAGGNLTGYADGFSYGPSRVGVSIGRYLGGGGLEYVAQRTVTPGAANAGPLVGPVVISEIMYHPVDVTLGGTRYDNSDDEYLEIRNITAAAVPLYDAAPPAGSWRLTGGVSFNFPLGTTLGPAEAALLVPFDPSREPQRVAAFKARYDVPVGVAIYGPYDGTLDNSGALLELQSPERFVFSPTRSERSYVRIDHVAYSKEEAWPAGADGIGPSLNRVNESAYGNDPFNWVAAATGPGSSHIPGALPVITGQPFSQTRIAYLDTVTFTVVAQGVAPLKYQWRFNGVPILDATGPSLVLPAVLPSQAGFYDVIVLNPSGAVSSIPAFLTLRLPVRFTLQPSRQDKQPGEAAEFAVAVVSTEPPVFYQWFRDGAPIAGATGSSYVISSVKPGDDGDFYCRVTDGVGSSNSVTARLTVMVRPFIVQQPVAQSAVSGAVVVFSIQVTNTATLPIGYRWRRTGANTSIQLLNSRTSYLVVTNVPPFGPANYTVVVTNFAETHGILSVSAALTVVADTDGDGLSDEFEAAYGLEVNNPADAVADNDGDTMINRDEYTAGTDPKDATKYLKVDRISIADGVRLEFMAVSNRTYTVQSTSALRSGSWTNVANVPAKAVNHFETVTDSFGGTRFYRLVTPAQP